MENLLHKVCFHHFNTYLCGTFSKKSINEEIMQTSLRIGTILKGRYRIEEVIAQGGFGITYLATDMLLENKIVIKEFFMKGNCNRNNETRNVEISTRGFTKQFTIFKSKFIKEAKTLYNLNFSKNIVHVHDVFEENGTAYYTRASLLKCIHNFSIHFICVFNTIYAINNTVVTLHL